MSKSGEIKARVARVLRGERRHEDLRAIFMWLREHHLGLPTILEVASFCAHPKQRDRGLSHCMIGNFADNIVGHVRSIQTDGYMGEEGRRLFRKNMIFNLDQMAPEEFERQFKIKKDAIRKQFLDAAEAVIGFEDGELILARQISDLEAALLREFVVMIVRTAFDSRRLMSEFIEGLTRTNLIEAWQKVHAAAHEDWLAVFAIGSMHLTQIKVDHDAVVTLYAGLSYDQDLRNLGVQAEVELSNFPKKVSMTAFSSRARAKNWCSSTIALDKAQPTITVPLEFAGDGKLQAIC